MVRLSSSVQTAIARCNADRCGAASVSCLVELFDEQSLIASMPFDQGVFILDEPEAALSPQRQLSFLKIVHDLATTGRAQFLIATHSPIILAYPGAVLFSLDGDAIEEIAYRDTKHYLITRDFLNSPERFFKHLFDEGRAPR